jgi:hypothetical protein
MRSIPFALLAIVLLACASHPPAASPSAASATSDPASASAAPSTNGPPERPSLESQREPFMKSCQEKAGSLEYCECGFQQFEEVFKDADTSKPLTKDDPRVATLQQKTIAACGSKLSEDQIKTSFVSGCVGDEAKRSGYCVCAWSTLRHTLKPADFVGTDLQGERFEQPKKAVTVACKGKYPPELMKAEFLKSCSSQGSISPSRCECMWKKVRAKFSVEELAISAPDLASVPGIADCK